MKTSTKTILCALALSGLTVTASFAEGKANHNWAEKAAQGYEKKAALAAASGNATNAKIYKRMAQIKRDAGAAAKNGKDFSWKEYEQLEKQLTHAGGAKKHDKKHDKKAGNGFLDAASEYEKKAAQAAAKGKFADAAIYSKLADMKRGAAAGTFKDWDAYHQLAARLSDHKKHKAKQDKDKAKHKAKGKSDNGFLKAADEYQEKANKAMAAGNEHNARIYTQLANMKRDAAAAAEKGKGYDWTEYFALQKQLK